tara:strand:+ start:100 stop:348 length:249 start_codon:yes stop_codon:yes gene_type:complete
MFSNKLKPIFTNKKNLQKLGPKRDGGYIVDKRIFDNYLYALEINFINSKIIKFSKKKSQHFPILGLDYPSVRRNEDIELLFK